MHDYTPLRRQERVALALASSVSALAVLGAVLLTFEHGAGNPGAKAPQALAAAEPMPYGLCAPVEAGSACAIAAPETR